ncbi:uncharacterized protein ColSpa_02816 [Colletotrichum spaethianum]|uniref:Uncharacterized protein n=1 Tax=Colletotrichum spaethianum TaxID=700344 RepID=A0AA37NXQ9_9PEZI|nr:uncharacterized protein ColSpa_02816 [Colletotrichum spaethianum]GKT42635.1 hypothetical protein ColSpa_02816 [Colletotrichum spaethianum]
MSYLSFSIGSSLALLTYGVHMDSLVALGSYFEEHRTQARVRIVVMALLLCFILGTELLLRINGNTERETVIGCAIRYESSADPYIISVWLALSWWFASGFRSATSQLRAARSEFPRTHTLVHWLVIVVHRGAESTSDLEYWALRETLSIRHEYTRRHNILLQSSPKLPFRITAPIIASAMIDDIWQSLIITIILNLGFTIFAMNALIINVVTEGVNYKALLEPKFGQVLPLVLLFGFFLTIMEANGVSTESAKKSMEDVNHASRTNSVANEPTSAVVGTSYPVTTDERISPPNTQPTGVEGSHQTAAEVMMSSGLSRRLTGDTMRNMGPSTVNRQPSPVLEVLELTSNTTPPSRVNTLQMESGVRDNPP